MSTGDLGEVHRVWDTRLDRTFAAKALPEHIAQRADLRARFEREARAMASLHHPNICVLQGVGGQGGTHSVVMELIAGETRAAPYRQRGNSHHDVKLRNSSFSGRQPRVRGLRITVWDVLNWLPPGSANGRSWTSTRNWNQTTRTCRLRITNRESAGPGDAARLKDSRGFLFQWTEHTAKS